MGWGAPSAWERGRSKADGPLSRVESGRLAPSKIDRRTAWRAWHRAPGPKDRVTDRSDEGQVASSATEVLLRSALLSVTVVAPIGGRAAGHPGATTGVGLARQGVLQAVVNRDETAKGARGEKGLPVTLIAPGSSGRVGRTTGGGLLAPRVVAPGGEVRGRTATCAPTGTRLLGTSVVLTGPQVADLSGAGTRARRVGRNVALAHADRGETATIAPREGRLLRSAALVARETEAQAGVTARAPRQAGMSAALALAGSEERTADREERTGETARGVDRPAASLAPTALLGSVRAGRRAPMRLPGSGVARLEEHVAGRTTLQALRVVKEGQTDVNRSLANLTRLVVTRSHGETVLRGASGGLTATGDRRAVARMRSVTRHHSVTRLSGVSATSETEHRGLRRGAGQAAQDREVRRGLQGLGVPGRGRPGRSGAPGLGKTAAPTAPRNQSFPTRSTSRCSTGSPVPGCAP